MCGIVCFLGHTRGPVKVLEALHLLEYRAPDSSGVAMLAGTAGELRVRRCVGSPSHLVAALAADPLFPVSEAKPDEVARLLSRQVIDVNATDLRDCSHAAGWTVDDLYRRDGLSIGIGDRGTQSPPPSPEHAEGLSAAMRRALDATKLLDGPLPDFDTDPARHAFRLLAAHVASRAAWDKACRAELDDALFQKVPAGAYTDWQAAWDEEMAVNVPGHAFAAAARYFQRAFPGLAEHLRPDDWGRVGGLTAGAMAQVVVGHGRWAMVGAVTRDNAHPLVDRSRFRAVAENGSHHVPLMLGLRAEQAAWWHARGVPQEEAAHRSDNTTEVVVYEWERAWHQLSDLELSAAEQGFRRRLEAHAINNPEEQALRIALRRMTVGNAHACAFYSRYRPGVLYVSSHRKPVAIAVRRGGDAEAIDSEIMVASDVNAALMLWAGSEVDAAALRPALRQARASNCSGVTLAPEQFEADLVFLDANLHGGTELLACIALRVEDGRIRPDIRVTRYDGEPVAVGKPPGRPLRLDPAMVGRGRHPTYTEHHIAEIPSVLDRLIDAYVADGRVDLMGHVSGNRLRSPGLNTGELRQRYGPQLRRLRRLWLVGEGSSWRDALAAAPLFRTLLPVAVSVVRPVELLNLGGSVDPDHDLAVEVSWSGTTDSLLKVDGWLADLGVLRLGITGRPQSDLARRTLSSAGALDVRTGVEVSVATVKGYHAILTTLDLLALQLADVIGPPGGAVSDGVAHLARELTAEVTTTIPHHVAALVADAERRRLIRTVARRFAQFNKVAVVGASPVDAEGELKIEELAQIVAVALPFDAESVHPMIQRTAAVHHDRERILFVVNATAPRWHAPADALLTSLDELGVSSIVHTTPHAYLAAWQNLSSAEVFVSPQVAEALQPLLDVLFYFELAVALAYARGLSPADIDRPRNLAKSVTTTGAERRQNVEARREFQTISLEDFAAQPADTAGYESMSTSGLSTVLERSVADAAQPPGTQLAITGQSFVEVETHSEAAADAVTAASAVWQDLLDIDLSLVRAGASPAAGPFTLRLLQPGAAPAVADARSITLPPGLTGVESELTATVFLAALAVRLAGAHGVDTTTWQKAVSRLPALVAGLHAEGYLRDVVREILAPYVAAGYDKLQIIGGGQDHAGARSIARTIRTAGFMAEALYTDSAWHGPLATVGGSDPEHDTLIVVLATDPLFQAAALVDTQVYRTRRAAVILVVPEGNQDSPAVRGVDPSAVLPVGPVPRVFLPLVHAVLGEVCADELSRLWNRREG